MSSIIRKSLGGHAAAGSPVTGRAEGAFAASGPVTR
jgi:hypothetical protein